MGYIDKSRNSTKSFCVFIDEDAPHVRHFDFEVFIAFKRKATQLGHEVSLRSLNYEENSAQSYDHIISSSNFDGAVVLGISNLNLYFDQLQATKHPTVILDHYIENPFVSSVCTDNINGLHLSINHLCQLGHRKIGFINGKENVYVCKERLAGYISGLTLNGLTFDPDLVRNGHFTEEDAAKFVKEMVDKGVTAIVCCNDLMAIGAIKELQSLGYHVPDDISVVGYDDIQLSSYITPPLTTVHTDLNEVGEKLYYALEHVMDNKRLEKIIQRTYLVERGSTGPAKTS